MDVCWAGLTLATVVVGLGAVAVAVAVGWVSWQRVVSLSSSGWKRHSEVWLLAVVVIGWGCWYGVGVWKFWGGINGLCCCC